MNLDHFAMFCQGIYLSSLIPKNFFESTYDPRPKALQTSRVEVYGCCWRQGSVTNDLKLKIYPAVIGILGAFLVASLLFNVEVQVERGIPAEGTVPTDRDFPPLSDPSQTLITEPLAPETPTPATEPALVAPESAVAVGVDAQGSLRVSNQTDNPLRVALLRQRLGEVSVDEVPASSEEILPFDQPVHWDFAPNEGRAKGLILSLPTGELQLQPGDVLVAFAQDGSRRYWGPYVVGETAAPVWNSETTEWQLILRP
jgi:hypothetical protein